MTTLSNDRVLVFGHLVYGKITKPVGQNDAGEDAYAITLAAPKGDPRNEPAKQLIAEVATRKWTNAFTTNAAGAVAPSFRTTLKNGDEATGDNAANLAGCTLWKANTKWLPKIFGPDGRTELAPDQVAQMAGVGSEAVALVEVRAYEGRNGRGVSLFWQGLKLTGNAANWASAPAGAPGPDDAAMAALGAAGGVVAFTPPPAAPQVPADQVVSTGSAGVPQRAAPPPRQEMHATPAAVPGAVAAQFPGATAQQVQNADGTPPAFDDLAQADW